MSLENCRYGALDVVVCGGPRTNADARGGPSFPDSSSAPTCAGSLGRAFTTPRTAVAKDNTVRYRACKADCDACSLKPRCCPNAPARKVPRSIDETARDKARAIAKTEAYIVSRRERKKVEMLFAHLKRILRLDRLRLRGPCDARDEFLLAATAQNLRKLAKLLPSAAPTMAA